MANAVDALTDRALELARLTIVRRIITAVAVTVSALIQTFLIQAFVQPADLLPSAVMRSTRTATPVKPLGSRSAACTSTPRSACSRSTSP